MNPKTCPKPNPNKHPIVVVGSSQQTVNFANGDGSGDSDGTKGERKHPLGGGG